MRKIVIFGNSGSGKSTLAGKLCEKHCLKHLDLDSVAWKPVIPPERKPMNESKMLIEAFVNANKAWAIEGCYSDLLELVMPIASEIIFLNLPVETCIANARRRPWEPHKYESKQAQDANLEMLISWITQYDERNDTFSRASHEFLFNAYEGKKTMHTANEQL